MIDPEAALLELSSMLEELALPYMVIGGLAVALWGEPRATIDVDLSLWVAPEDLEPVVGALCERLSCLPQDPLAFVQNTRVLPAMTAAGVRVDLVFAPSRRNAKRSSVHSQSRWAASRSWSPQSRICC